MEEHLQNLIDGINRWRAQGISDYWLNFSYMGPVLHHFGDHTITVVGDKAFHAWDDDWRVLAHGGDFWLFTVPGTFAWTRDILMKVAQDPSAVTVRFDPQYGIVRGLSVKVAKRDEHNFTLDVRDFGVGKHPNFKG
ncbi:MAG: hypothetical protein GYB64_09120 [Chloroflexi bacterium]|nr:hypothetical protein [Chloroflexota bacterium]